jgi:hypothetical protein
MTPQTTTQQLTRDTIEIPYQHVTTHFIDGAWRQGLGDEIIEVTDPATNTVWGSVPIGKEDDVTAAVEAAHAAFTTGRWSKTTPSERAEIMLRFADEIEQRATELSLTNTLENASRSPRRQVLQQMPPASSGILQLWHQSLKPTTCAPSPTVKENHSSARTPSVSVPSLHRGTS